jgi:hypothetical protein
MANYDIELQSLKEEMQRTEASLIASGFSAEQWNLIKTYIASALAFSAYASSHTKE